MGKWSHLKGKYPKMPIEADYQQKIDIILDSAAPACVLNPAEVKKEFRIRELSDFQIAQLYQAARNNKEALEAQVSLLNLEIEAYTRLLVTRFEDAGETSKRFDNGIQLIISDEPYPIVTSKDNLFAWLENNGMERLDLMQFSASKMSSLVKGSLAEGKELPGGVDIFMKTSLTRRQ